MADVYKMLFDSRRSLKTLAELSGIPLRLIEDLWPGDKLPLEYEKALEVVLRQPEETQHQSDDDAEFDRQEMREIIAANMGVDPESFDVITSVNNGVILKYIPNMASMEWMTSRQIISQKGTLSNAIGELHHLADLGFIERRRPTNRSGAPYEWRAKPTLFKAAEQYRKRLYNIKKKVLKLLEGCPRCPGWLRDQIGEPPIYMSRALREMKENKDVVVHRKRTGRVYRLPGWKDMRSI